MKVKVICRKSECRKDIHGLGLGVAFFATSGPGLDLTMYIFTALEFPRYKFDFHLLTMSVDAK